MRIVIDLQACQDGSHGRGIGRYAMSMARALIRNGRGRHSFRVLLSDRFPDRVAPVRVALSDLLAPHEIVVGAAPGRIESAHTDFAWRTRASEIVWNDFIQSFQPDAYFTPSLFEGFWEDAVTSIEPGQHLRAATVHDLIPLADPDFYLGVEGGGQRAYARKITALQRCDFLFSVSEFSRQDAISRLGVDPRKIFVVPLGVEPEFCPGTVSEARRDDLLRKYRLRGRFVINTSPFEARKNIGGLIAGFATVPQKERVELQLVIAGKMSPDDRNAIADIVRAEGLNPADVVLTGFVPDEDLIDLYRLCEVMVFPPFSEGFGLPPLEAMACGAAVLASSATSVPEVVGREDVLFDPAEPGDIGRAIRKVLGDAAYRDELRAFGPKQAATFSWDRSACDILKVFENAAVRARPKMATAVLAPGVVKLAVVATSGPTHSRESLLVKDYVRRLSLAYDVTLYRIDGDLESDIILPLESRSVEEFAFEGGSFDKALYILDSSRTDVALALMAARPGALLLYEPLVPADARNMTSAQVADMRAAGGFRAIANGLGGGAVEWKRGAAAAALAHGVAVESDSGLAGAPGTVTVSPRVGRVPQSCPKDFLCARQMPADARLWAAFVEDEQAASRVLQTFRRFQGAAEDKVWLVLIPARGTMKEGPLSGRAYVMPNGFTGPYAELMSASESIFIDDALPALTRLRLRDDAEAFGLDVLDDALDRSGTEAARDKSRGWSSDQDADFLAGLDMLLEAAPAPLAAPPEILRRMPMAMLDRRPTAEDVNDVASALALNIEHRLPGRVLIDVTPALVEAEGKFTGVARRFLRALLSDPDVQLVASDGETYFAAGAFASVILDARGLQDETIWLRERDVLVGLDLLGDVSGGAAGLGVRQVRLHAIDTLYDRPDLAQPIADALVEVVRREALSSPTKASTAPLRRSVEGNVVHLRLDGSELAAPKARMSRKGKATAALALALATPPPRRDSRLDTAFTVQGHVWGSYSLAIVNRRIARVLDEAFPSKVSFAPVETTSVSDLSKTPAEDRPYIQSLLGGAKPAAIHATISQHYPIQPPQGRTDVAMALVAWEESHMPPGMRDMLNGAFDGVLAQVRTVQKALIDSGVWIPAALTGLPVDISDYQDSCRRDGPARAFLHISSCFPRKGVDALLEAWAQAFTVKDDVELVIKTFPNPHNDVQQRLIALARRHPAMAPVRIVNRDMTRDELIDLYRDADVMVLPTRGEGYNLPALEAMAAGLPLIVTGYGGHRDFCGSAEARLLDYRFALSGSHVRETVSYWADPVVEDLVEALREQTRLDQQPIIEARRKRAQDSARRAVAPARWSRAVADFAQSLVGPVERSAVRTSWVSTWSVRCGIAEYSRYLLDHMSSEWLKAIQIIADDRTTGEAFLAPHRAGWAVSFDHDPERLLEAIEKDDPEAVVIQHQDGLIFWRHLATLARDSRLTSRVSVVTLHTVRSLDDLEDGERLRVIEALRRLDRVLVHTVGDLNDLKRHGLIDNVSLFPHGAIKLDIAPPTIRRLTSSDSPVIGCHGFFFEHKRIDNLIRAAARLKERWPRLRLRLVNARFPDATSNRAVVEAQAVAAEVGMTDSIDWFTDFLPVDEILDLLAGCDLLVLPYDETGDSVSGAVRVAMSSHVPTLTTPVKIFSDVGEAVASTPSNDPEVLAEAVARLLDSVEDRAALQERMTAWLSAHDWRRTSANLEGMIKALAYARRREARATSDGLQRT